MNKTPNPVEALLQNQLKCWCGAPLHFRQYRAQYQNNTESYCPLDNTAWHKLIKGLRELDIFAEPEHLKELRRCEDRIRESVGLPLLPKVEEKT